MTKIKGYKQDKNIYDAVLPIAMDSTTRMPRNFREFNGDEIMTNLDGEIAQETADYIKDQELFSRYAGWNFNGRVWWQNYKWLCEVWCHHRYQETVVCDTLKDIMEKVSSKYGYE